MVNSKGRIGWAELPVTLVALLGVLSSLFVSFFCQEPEYRVLFVHPLLFAFCFWWALYPALRLRFRVFYYVFTMIGFLRYVVLPFLIVAGGYYSTSSKIHPLPGAFEVAHLLMAWELIASSGLVMLLNYFNRKRDAVALKRDSLSANQPPRFEIYGIFIMIALVLFIVVPEAASSISFLFARSKAQVAGSKTTIFVHLASYLIYLGKQILCVYLLVFGSIRFRESADRRYLLLILIGAGINLLVYNGLNRSDFLISAASTVLLVVLLNPRFLRKSILLSVPFVIIVFALITRSRQYYAPGSGILGDLAYSLNSYASGVGNVALAVEMTWQFPEYKTPLTLLNDFLRGALGFNLLFKNLNVIHVNQLFNKRIYMSDHMAQILPMIGEGYYFFGLLGAPLIDMLFLLIADTLNNLSIKFKDKPLLVYFLSITCIRLGFMQGQNATIQMNDLSFNLFVSVPLVFASELYEKFMWRSRLVTRE